jgi:hypothetical protein
MKKRIIDCTYKEVRDYYKHHRWNTQVAMLLGAFGKPYLRNEVSWQMRVKHDFPKIFKKEFLESEIEVDE